MPYKGGFNKIVNREQFVTLVESLNVTWPRYVMIHNTYRPSMAMEDAYKPGQLQRLKNFGEGYFKPKGWAGPHLFVFNDAPQFGLGCPLHLTGVGSPGFNATAWHIEGVADFTLGVDDDDAGKGFAIKDSVCYATAVLLMHRGLTDAAIKFHWEDPATTHRGCPGADLVKADVVARVKAYMKDLGEVGDHGVDDEAFQPFDMWVDCPANDPLNVRSEGGLKGNVVAQLKRGVKVRVLDAAANGSISWYKIERPAGWISSRFLTDKEPAVLVAAYASTTKVDTPKPVETPVIAPVKNFVEPLGMDRPTAAVKYYMDQGIPLFKAAAAVGRFQRESYASMKDDVWGDYMIDGKRVPNKTPGSTPTSLGIGQWRGLRYDHLVRYAAERQQPLDYFYLQLDFFLEELAHSKETVLARRAWEAATNVREACLAMMHYERPSGYQKDAPEKGDGYAETLAFATGHIARVEKGGK